MFIEVLLLDIMLICKILPITCSDVPNLHADMLSALVLRLKMFFLTETTLNVLRRF